MLLFKRLLFTLLVLLASPILWVIFIFWFIIPEDYEAAGSLIRDIGTAGLILTPFIGIVCALIAWFSSEDWEENKK
ncbi:MAG: hypothetical protein AAFR87_22760 [Bacteroidota bacterium]